MLSHLIKSMAPIFFTTALKNLRRTAEASVTTAKPSKSRKEHKPKDSAIDMATAMDVEILTENSVPGIAGTWRIRYQNLELGANSWCYQKTQRRPFLRPALWYGFRISQWRRILLCGQRFSGFVKYLKILITAFYFQTAAASDWLFHFREWRIMPENNGNNIPLLNR